MTAVAVLGGGQLARMLALAAVPLDITVLVLSPEPNCPAGPVAEVIVAAFDDQGAQDLIAARATVVTYQLENVPIDAIAPLAARLPVRPSLEALRIAQDRLLEKQTFGRLGIRTPPHAAVDDQSSLEAAAARIGLPAVLKTRRLGYDGKGQRVLRGAEDLVGAFDDLGGVPCILESFVRFRRELSVLAVRSTRGETATYPLVENRHEDGILRVSRAPAADVAAARAQEACHWADRLMTELDYVGVLALELFEDDDGLLANEIAPRVHNSGHWTIEGAQTSQFENHLRAVLGLPLGSCAARGPAMMVNLVGALPETEAVLSIPGAHLHLYGKAPRPGRKVGHVTVAFDDEDAVCDAGERVRALVLRA